MNATTRTYNAAANDRLPGRRRLGAAVAVALLAGAVSGAAPPPANPPWLLRADSLETSDRTLLLALAVRKKTGAPDRAQEAGEHVSRLRSRLLLAAAAVRSGYADDPAVQGPLEEYRFRHLLDQIVEEQVDRPARQTAGENNKPGFRYERERLFKELGRRALEEFPPAIDEKALAAVGRGEPGDRVVARIAGGEITAEQLRREMQRVDHPLQKKENTGDQLARMVLGTLATQRCLVALAAREGLAARPDFVDDMNDRRIRLLAELYTERDVYPGVRVDPADVEARYRRSTERLRRGAEREISEILVGDEETAKAVAARLAAGAPFADEVRANSIGTSREAGGRLGYLQDKQAIPELDRAIQALREKEISPPVRTSFGWHILRCDAIVNGRVPPLEEVRGALEAEEMGERRAAAVRERVSGLEREIPVVFNERRYEEIVKGQVR